MVGVAQAESQAVRNLVLQHRHRLVAYLSYHSFGQKIMYPWSYTDEKVESVAASSQFFHRCCDDTQHIIHAVYKDLCKTVCFVAR